VRAEQFRDSAALALVSAKAALSIIAFIWCAKEAKEALACAVEG